MPNNYLLKPIVALITLFIFACIPDRSATPASCKELQEIPKEKRLLHQARDYAIRCVPAPNALVTGIDKRALILALVNTDELHADPVILQTIRKMLLIAEEKEPILKEIHTKGHPLLYGINTQSIQILFQDNHWGGEEVLIPFYDWLPVRTLHSGTHSHRPTKYLHLSFREPINTVKVAEMISELPGIQSAGQPGFLTTGSINSFSLKKTDGGWTMKFWVPGYTGPINPDTELQSGRWEYVLNEDGDYVPGLVYPDSDKSEWRSGQWEYFFADNGDFLSGGELPVEPEPEIEKPKISHYTPPLLRRRVE